MSNSNLYGHIDRRVPTPPEDIRVGALIGGVYKQCGFVIDEKRGSKNDPDSRASRELAARRLGFRHLDPGDRQCVDGCVKVLTEKAGIGDDAALDILMRIGIFLKRCGV